MTRARGLPFITLAAAAAMLCAPVEARAQRHGPVGPRARGAVIIAAAPYYYNYSPFWYDPLYAYQIGYPYPYPPFGYAYDRSASLHLLVEPRQTEVYVDGYYAGPVDDFDGVFQRLHVQPGQHDIELYHEGYRTYREQVYLQPGKTFTIRHTMEPLQPGDAPAERPVVQPPGPPSTGAPPPPPPAPPSRARRPAPPRNAPAESSFGSLVIQVQPADADILIDGETWQAPGDSTRLVIQLSPGEHQVEVRKSGFATYRSSVRIRRGETTPLNVSLTQQ